MLAVVAVAVGLVVEMLEGVGTHPAHKTLSYFIFCVISKKETECSD